MSLLWFLVAILILVGVHEWGHFAAARLCGVGVKRFSIGFGKAIFEHTDKKTGTVWGLAWIPLGGYVALKHEQGAGESAGEVTDESAGEGEVACLVVGKSFISASLIKKISIISAGPLINLLLAWLIYSVLFLGQSEVVSPLVVKPKVDSAIAIAGLKQDARIVAVNGEKIAHWGEALRLIEQTPAEAKLTIELQAIPENGGGNTAYEVFVPVVKPQASKTEAIGLKLKTDGLKITQVIPNSAALRAGMQAGDTLLAIHGKPVDAAEKLSLAIAKAREEKSTLNFLTLRSGGEVRLAIDFSDEINFKAEKIGIVFSLNPKLQTNDVSIVNAFLYGAQRTWDTSVATIGAVGDLLKNPFSFEQLAGPVTIAGIAKTSANAGFSAFFGFLAALSISVGILNLLPVPVLDGGQIVYQTARSLHLRLFGRVFSPSMDAVWNKIGLVLIALLTIIAFGGDWVRHT